MFKSIVENYQLSQRYLWSLCNSFARLDLLQRSQMRYQLRLCNGLIVASQLHGAFLFVHYFSKIDINELDKHSVKYIVTNPFGQNCHIFTLHGNMGEILSEQNSWIIKRISCGSFIQVTNFIYDLLSNFYYNNPFSIFNLFKPSEITNSMFKLCCFDLQIKNVYQPVVWSIAFAQFLHFWIVARIYNLNLYF